MRDKIVIITGASSGIGRALAFEFGRRGSKLMIAARNVENLNNTVEALKSDGIVVAAVQADVSKEEDCRLLVARTVETYGRIDVLINNAGISMRALFADVDMEVMHKLMNVNFWGTVYCSRYALPYLLASGGSLVGIISIAGHIGLPARSGYSASKFAVRGFLDTVRCENRYNGLHVLVAAPGFTESNIRKAALTADGSVQNETPRDESKMMSAEVAAHKIYLAVVKRKRNLVLTFIEGKLTVFLNKWFPALVERLAFSHMAKEPDSPLKKKF